MHRMIYCINNIFIKVVIMIIIIIVLLIISLKYIYFMYILHNLFYVWSYHIIIVL